MGRNRTDLRFADSLDELDLSEFKPRQAPSPHPPSGETSQVAEAAGYRIREPKATENPASGAAPQRRRRTRRNAQFNLKARPETIAPYCALADRMEWGLGEMLEKAVEKLEERYGSEKEPR